MIRRTFSIATLVALTLGPLFGLSDLLRVFLQTPELDTRALLLAVSATKAVGLAVAYGFVIAFASVQIASRWGRRPLDDRRATRAAVAGWIFLHAFISLWILGFALAPDAPGFVRPALRVGYFCVACLAAVLLYRPLAWAILALRGRLRPRAVIPLLALILLALCGLWWSEKPASRRVARGTGPNVLLLVVDTLRADALGCYGYPLPASPRLDALAREGVRFDQVMAPSSWTIPSMASLLTGVEPSVHRVTNAGIILPDSFEALPEAFQAAGYATGARVANTLINGDHGYFQGFDDATIVLNPYLRLVQRRILASMGLLRRTDLATADVITRSGITWIERHRHGPFFLYLHYFDPHLPYYPPTDYARRFTNSPMARRYLYRSFHGPRLWALMSEYRRGLRLKPEEIAFVRAVYEGEVSYVDDQIGRLLDYLRGAGLEKNTIVVLVSDHGEQFHEHGAIGHSKTLYTEEIRIPLIIRVPGLLPRVIRRRVTLLDLYPTLIDLAGLSYHIPDPSLVRRLRTQPMGSSLAAAMRDGDPAGIPPEDLYLSMDLDGRIKDGLLRGNWKLILNRSRRDDVERPPVELYDLSRDPAERRNMARERPADLQRMRSDYAEGRAAMASRATTHVEEDPEKRHWIWQMRALGYIN